MLGLLQARQAFIFPRNKTWPKSRETVQRRDCVLCSEERLCLVLALSKAHVLALNTAHVLRLNKADVLALNKAHVLRLNTKTCPVFTANTKEAAFGRLHKGGRPSAAPLCGFPYEACWRPRQGKARQTARQDQLSRAKAKQARQPSQISKGQGSQGPMQGAQKTNILCKKKQKYYFCEFSDTYGWILDGTIALFHVFFFFFLSSYIIKQQSWLFFWYFI